MKISEFVRLKVLESLLDIDGKQLSMGENFLTGKNMIGQKEIKREKGNKISYYKVTKAEGDNISYTTVLDILEEG